MVRRKVFAVIGIGRFGTAVLKELAALGNEVLAIDIDEASVNEVSHIASHALICDSTDDESLKNIGIKNIDHVVVAIGENVQASILTSLILKEIGVKEITVKATTDNHERVLRKIGITDIIHPEIDMGKRIARRITSNYVMDAFELSEKHKLVELKSTPKILQKKLSELDLRKRMGINIVAIKRHEEIILPDAEDIIKNGDILIVVGSNQAIDRFDTFLGN